jgi:hypothetical protein
MGATLAAAEAELDALIAKRGWRVHPESPARRTVAKAIGAFHQLGAENLLARIDDYADAAERVAAADLEAVRHHTARDTMVREAIIGTIIGDTLMAGLRRLAQEDRSARIFGRPPASDEA